MKRRFRRLRAAVRQVERAASPAGARRRKYRQLRGILREHMRQLRLWYAGWLYGPQEPPAGVWVVSAIDRGTPVEVIEG